jgi:hypothetical protein
MPFLEELAQPEFYSPIDSSRPLILKSMDGTLAYSAVRAAPVTVALS